MSIVEEIDDEAGGSSVADSTAPELASDVPQGSGNSMNDCPAASNEAPRKRLCIMHQSAIRNRNTNSVACQTDLSDDYEPIGDLNTKATVTTTDVSAGCSDGVLRLMIQNFRNMGDTVRGPSKRIQGVNWRIMVMPRQHVVQKKGTQKCLGFFLQCCPDAFSDAWQCQAAAELRLMSQKPGVPHFTRKTNHTYTAKENDWGYSCFMTWSDILDETQGYIKDDRVVLEVTVKAEEPKNVLTLEEFRKQIQSWYDLAEMQYQRGCIDLAIEANAQALKFCKDKDADCRTRLDEQKAYFIEAKLVESIHRIEKAGPNTANEDTTSNQTALRMALTSSNTNKGNKKDKNKKTNIKKARAATPNGSKVKVTQVVKAENTNTAKNEDVKSAEKEADSKDTNDKKEKKQVEMKQEKKADDAPKTKEVLQMADAFKSENNEQPSKQAISAAVAAVDNGHFNKNFFRHDQPLSWMRRSRAQDALYSDLTRALTSDDYSNEPRDVYIMRYMSDKMKRLYIRHISQGGSPDERDWYTMDDLRMFAEEAFEAEMQRHGDQPNEDSSPDCELDIMWDGSQRDDQIELVDVCTVHDDDKEGGPSGENDEGCSGSDEESECSNDSGDRQNDGCLKPKRSKIDNNCDTCLRESSDQPYVPPTMCDSEAQTDLPKTKDGSPKPAASNPNGRIVKKVTKPVIQKCTRKEEPEVADIPDSPASPDILPHDVFQLPLNFECTEDQQHMMAAMSTVALNLINLRRLMSKVEEIMAVSTRNMSDETIRNALRDFSKLAGLAYVEHEDKYRPTTAYKIEEVEADLQTIWQKLISEDSKDSGDLVSRVNDLSNNMRFPLEKQIDRLEYCREHLEKFYFIDHEDCERLAKGTSNVETKLNESLKKLKESQKHSDDSDAKLKKIEKTLKDEAKVTKQQLNSEKERNAMLNKEVKEKTKQNKSLETRLSVLSSEKDDLVDKTRQMQKELQGVQKKASDDAQKHKREVQQLNETKKHLQNDLHQRDSDIKSFNAQLEEKNALIKKLREELSVEKNRLNTVQQNAAVSTERAKKSEIAFLQQQLDSGLSRLERAKEDASKNMKEMEDAAGNRARSSNDVAICLTSRDEWAGIIDQLKSMIENTRAEYSNHMEAIRSGKNLSSLPKIAVPSPPPAPQIIKVAPIAPVEPTKPVPGVIGTRPHQQPVGRAISPSSRAPGSPINQSKPTTSTMSTNSPARHGPIGTRPNGTPVSNPDNSATSSSSQSSNTLTQWSWSDSLSAITESLHPAKRFSSSNNEFSASLGNDLIPSISTDPMAAAWSNDPNWANNLSIGSSLNVGNGLNSTLSSNSNNLASSLLNSSAINNQSSIGASFGGVSSSNASNLFNSSVNAVNNSMTSMPPQPQQSSYSQANLNWGTSQDIQRQYIYRQQQHYQQVITAISKKLGLDMEKAHELMYDFCREHKMQAYNAAADEQLLEKLRDHYTKRYPATTLRMAAPPGAAPGYALQNPLLGTLMMDRQMTPTYDIRPLMDQHQMPGSSDRSGMSNSEKWSNGI